MMKKILCAVVMLAVSSCAIAAPAKIGVLAPIGMNEQDVIAWSENVAGAEGKSPTFRNPNTIVIFDDMTAMIMALRAGKIDRFAIGNYTAEYITTRNKDFTLIDHKHNAILGFSLAMRTEDNPKMLAINLAINDMKADGTLKRLIEENILGLGDKDPIAYDMPKIEGADTMRVAITGDIPPMDCILADGRPAGFNTAFLAELSRRIKRNIELVSVSAGARQSAISSGKVDAVFWTRNSYNMKRELLPYPLDKMEGVVISDPYLFDSRVAVSMSE